MSVAIVGSINRDVVARVSRIPRPGETVLATDSSSGGGGKGANQAVAAARAAGASTCFVGAVGDDADGASLRAALAADGIDVSGLATVSAPTGTALISVDEDGENAIVVIAGANSALEHLSEGQRMLVAQAEVVIAQLEIPVSAVLEAAAARAAGAIFVLNAAPSAPLSDPRVAARLLPEVDVLVVNEHELSDIAAAVAGVPAGDLAGAVDALASRVPALVVTLGARGAIIATGGDRRSVDAFAVDVVDTTGAGDTYCGVLAAHLASRHGRQHGGVTAEALVAGARAAAAAAALAVGRPGAQSAVPTEAEVGRMLDAPPPLSHGPHNDR